MATNMQSLLDQTNEQRTQLANIVVQRKDLEKLVELKEQKLQIAKERNRDPKSHTEAQEYRIQQILENHKQAVAELDLLRSEMEDLAILNIEAKDRQRDRLQAHQMVMKDLAQKFQTGPATYMNLEEMKGKLCRLEEEHQSINQKVKSVRQEEARKKAMFRQMYPVDPVKLNTVTLDGNMPVILQKLSKQKQRALKESKAKELQLQKKLKNLQQLSSLLQTDLSRLEAKLGV